MENTLRAVFGLSLNRVLGRNAAVNRKISADMMGWIENWRNWERILRGSKRYRLENPSCGRESV